MLSFFKQTKKKKEKIDRKLFDCQSTCQTFYNFKYFRIIFILRFPFPDCSLSKLTSRRISFFVRASLARVTVPATIGVYVTINWHVEGGGRGNEGKDNGRPPRTLSCHRRDGPNRADVNVWVRSPTIKKKKKKRRRTNQRSFSLSVLQIRETDIVGEFRWNCYESVVPPMSRHSVWLLDACVAVRGGAGLLWVPLSRSNRLSANHSGREWSREDRILLASVL